MKSADNLQGQIVLITVLVLTIAMTVALSLIGRATTDVGMSAQLEDSARAFSAAEAGIEKALKTNTGETATQLANGETFTSVVSTIGGSSSVYEPDQVTKKGEVETIWLVHHNADGTLNETDTNDYTGAIPEIDICWRQAVPVPAISISVFYKNSLTGEYTLSRHAFDFSLRGGFDAATVADKCGTTGVYYKHLTYDYHPIAKQPLFLRITSYYNDAKLLISPFNGRALPDQGVEISSTGSTAGGVTRKIVVKRQYQAPSSLFDHVVYSQQLFGH